MVTDVLKTGVFEIRMLETGDIGDRNFGDSDI